MKLSNAASKASIHRGSIGQDATTSTSTLVQEIGLCHLTSMNADGEDITAFERCILTLLWRSMEAALTLGNHMNFSRPCGRTHHGSMGM